MYCVNMDKDEIIKQITSELLDEIKSSNKVFTSEEVKAKINAKLDAVFNSGVDNGNSLDEEDEVLNNEFTKISGNEDSFALNSGIDGDFNDNVADNEIADKKEEKVKFFQEVADIYKNEFNNSITCFKNALESLKLVRKTSFFETILVVIFLVVPAILAGCIALIIVLILFLLWQLYLITKSIFELLKKAEVSIKGINEKIRKKIRALRGSGGFLNRLIFSNALYSLMMFNGVMYMLVKGLMLPVKSILDVEKILTNILAKIEKGITTVLKAPSELALAGTSAEAAKGRRGAKKEKDAKTKSGSRKPVKREKTAEKVKPIEKEKAQIRPQQQKVKVDEVSKALHQARLEVANAVAKNLQAETSQQKAQDIGDRAINLAEKAERQQVPMSSILSLSSSGSSDRDDLAKAIFDSVVDAMRGASLEKGADSEGIGKGIDTTKMLPEVKDSLMALTQAHQQELEKIEDELQSARDNKDLNAVERLENTKEIAINNLEELRQQALESESLEDFQQRAHSLQKDDPMEYAAKMDSMTFEDGQRVLPEGFSMKDFLNESKGLPTEEFDYKLISQLEQTMSNLDYREEDKDIVIAAVIEHQKGLSKEVEESRGHSMERSERGFVGMLDERVSGGRQLEV